MDWVKRMNEAIRYIEDHLADEIDYAEAAKVACCSAYHFQRMFSFMAEVSLSEYIRRRRLTLAAFELQNSRIKVVDLALKYGYDSPEAFAR
ncbi:MAG: helix-turn-helix domain-containing protein, partial [Brevibacillus sp.]